MGWASGSTLAEHIFYAILPHIRKGQEEKVINQVLDLFEDFDCDTLCELDNHSNKLVRKVIEERYSDEE